ncbi:S46 family peptidase [Mesorhizobium sp. M0590]|uniref:S46 family peptidase n=1 Tax=Mesorhizobium sp. M0590 TaxID=2956966 RepID=UPI00333D0CC8
MRTTGEVRFNFAHYEPQRQHLLSEYAAHIKEAMTGNRDAQIRYAAILQGLENSEKKLAGDLAGADAIGLNARKKAYRDWVADDPARQARYGAAIRELDVMVAENSRA